MTPMQRKLHAALKAAVDDGPWDTLSGNTARFMRCLPTPDWARRGTLGFGGVRTPATWSEPTYPQILFLTVITGNPWTVILGKVTAPGGGRRDITVSMTRAMEILADPIGELER